MRFFFWCGAEHFISELPYKGRKNILFYERAKKQMIFYMQINLLLILSKTWLMIQIINGGSARYLSELPEFQNGLPHGIVNKTKTDVGGTYVAANCNSNYIIVCPFRDLVDSIAADKNNRYEVFKCYGGVKEYQFRKYIMER